MLPGRRDGTIGPARIGPGKGGAPLVSPGHGKPVGLVAAASGCILREKSRRPRKRCIWMAVLACCVLPALAAPAWGRAISEEDGFAELTKPRSDPIDQINEALRRYGRVFLWVGVGLSAVAMLKIVGPVQIYYGVQDRRLKRAVRAVDELLKRIQKEAEVTSEAPKEETAVENGLLAGMIEIAEFEQAEQMPSYVLTVNDLMLDNIGRDAQEAAAVRRRQRREIPGQHVHRDPGNQDDHRAQRGGRRAFGPGGGCRGVLQGRPAIQDLAEGAGPLGEEGQAPGDGGRRSCRS